MKLDFLLNNIKRDLKLAPVTDGNKISLHDVFTIIERWEKALIDEFMLTESEQRFQDILAKEQLTQEDGKEALDLLMFMHRPLIAGRNDVMGIRLRDADYLRLHNRMAKLPVEHGIEDFNRKIMQLEREERERKRAEREKAKAKKKKHIIEIDLEDLQ